MSHKITVAQMAAEVRDRHGLDDLLQRYEQGAHKTITSRGYTRDHNSDAPAEVLELLEVMRRVEAVRGAVAGSAPADAALHMAFLVRAAVRANLPSFEDGIKRRAQRKAGQGKRGKEGPLKRTLRRVTSELTRPGPKEVLAAVSDLAHMENLYLAPTNPVPLLIQDVDADAKRILYVRQDGREGSASFKTIANHVREILKPG